MHPKALEMTLGQCIILGAEPYAKELKKDYNLDILQDDSFDTGKLVATWFLKECPDMMMELFNTDENNTKEKDDSELLISGNMTK